MAKQHVPEPHRFRKLAGVPWPYCPGCGLLKLHNPLTDWCVRHGCNHEEHPGYRAAVRTLTAREPADA